MFLATVGFRGLGHDGGCGVAVLYVTRGCAHYSRGGAGLQPQRDSNAGHDSRRDGRYHLVNLVFVHSGLGVCFKRAVFRNIPF